MRLLIRIWLRASLSAVMAGLFAPACLAEHCDAAVPAAEAESAWDAESGTCLADWRANTWGNETMTLHHWCREHAENMDRPVHYNSVHQHMRFEARILYVANNDWTKERITKVVIELGHQGDGNPVRTWEWTPGKADELELSGAHDFTVLMDKCWKTLGVGAFDGRGRYSATATATIELIKRKDDPKVHRTRTLTATTEFDVIEFDTAIANTAAKNDDLVQIRDAVCMHNFFERLHVFLKAPGLPGRRVAGTITATKDQAPFTAWPGVLTTKGAAPATQQAIALDVPGDPGAIQSNGLPSASQALVIHGKAKSNVLNEEVYHLTMDKDPCDNKPAATRAATVFWFGAATMAARIGGRYVTKVNPSDADTVDFFPVDPGQGIEISGHARIFPDGVSQRVRQTEEIEIGFVQILNKGSINYKWNLLRKVYAISFPSGSSAAVPEFVFKSATIARATDSTDVHFPFYAIASEMTPNSRANVYPAPRGTSPARMGDTPGAQGVSRVISLRRDLPEGISRLDYRLALIDIDYSFTTFLVLFDASSYPPSFLIPLMELDWNLVVSTRMRPGGTAQATPSRYITQCPVIPPPPTAIEQLNEPRALQRSSSTTVATKP